MAKAKQDTSSNDDKDGDSVPPSNEDDGTRNDYDSPEDETPPSNEDGDTIDPANFTIVQAKAMANEINLAEDLAHSNQYVANAVAEHYLRSLPEGTALKESDLYHVSLVSRLVSKR